ncbi:MAG: hypothetical protein IT169_01860 [Bryobacterales bacterium]|nr:hypothetical protein [Bryobacterales bacterium]
MLPLVLLVAATPWCALAQNTLAAREGQDRWVPFGNTSILAGVAGEASGPVERVWFDGAAPAVQLPDGEIYRWMERRGWALIENATSPERPENRIVPRPRADARFTLAHPMARNVVYALGDQIYRSDDGGTHWTGLTRYRGISLLGESLADLALNPLDPEDLLVAGDLGIWRSRDSGLTWFHAGEGLPTFSATKILRFPEGARGFIVELRDGRTLEWVPGSVHGWKLLVPAFEGSAPPAVRKLGLLVSAWDSTGAQIYVGRTDGALLSSADDGATWRAYTQPDLKAVRALYVNPDDERMAIAVADSDTGATLLLRTLNGGAFWDNWTPLGLNSRSWDAAAPGFAQDALFLVEGQTTYRFHVDFRSMSRPSSGLPFRLDGLPARAVDLRLDPSGTILYALAENRGVYSVEAPGVAAQPLVRNAADLGRAPATPGALLSVYGEPFRRLRANGADAVLLGKRPGSAQVQLPYGLVSDRVELAFEGNDNQIRTLALPLRPAQPSIFLHPDGNPFVLHPENGLFMDENNPIPPGSRFQVLLAGLGAVSPDWPSGMAAPLENPPAVVAHVEAFVNGLRIPVIKATLAPGYAGIYLVELELPGVMDEGLAELRIVAGGNASNPAGIHIAY